ncbi:hypothetical protein WJX84_000879, partial [Apatococcus fuscideae]
LKRAPDAALEEAQASLIALTSQQQDLQSAAAKPETASASAQPQLTTLQHVQWNLKLRSQVAMHLIALAGLQTEHADKCLELSE